LDGEAVFYDRFLKRFKGKSVGICYDDEIVGGGLKKHRTEILCESEILDGNLRGNFFKTQALPRDEYDLAVEKIVTERGII